jgi:signal transduction histidine kinase
LATAPAPLKILLVEDSELDAELLLYELAADGLNVVSERVETEADFVRALATFAPDAIVSDLAMPEFSGYRALEIARTNAVGTPFLFVSGTMGEEAAVEALRSGATDYVLKQNLARLASAVKRALAEAEDRRARTAVEAELMRAQRYESLALLASGLSHDLRNVLQPISMGVSMLVDDPREEIRKVGQLITDCTQRGLDIVASMLSFAKGSRASVHRVGVKSLIDGLAMLLRSSLGRNVQLHVASPEASLEIEGNHTELQQCLLNLCLNGAQAMPDGGELRMEADIVTLEDDFFEGDDVRAPGRYLRTRISDTGVGMSEDVRNRLFQPFFTTKEKGTGLGLLSCRRILTNHQGYLRLASEPGKGTTFSLYLPMRLSDELPATGEMAHGRGERVLVVIERESKMVMLRDIIESHKYTVISAENGAVAVQSLDAGGLPDVVLMDGQMNLTTGVLTASKLLDMDYSGPLILIAAPESREEIEHDLPPLPNIRFIGKPVDPDELLDVLAQELHRNAGAAKPPAQR